MMVLSEDHFPDFRVPTPKKLNEFHKYLCEIAENI